jgi:hypothetical protein
MSALTPWNARLTQWLHDPAVLASVGFGLAILGLVSLIALPWLVVRIPADYFTRAHATEPRSPTERLGWFIKNLFGMLVLLAGVLMLVLPGQGILTIFAALVLLDFPGKRRLERWLIQRSRLLSRLNALRARARRPPLEWDD